MKSRISDKSRQLPYPKLMINENVIVLFGNREDGIVVHRISKKAILVGDNLSRGSFEIEKFSDYHGVVELSNK
jgi:hypothetical protein